jgi:hypothetical protein
VAADPYQLTASPFPRCLLPASLLSTDPSRLKTRQVFGKGQRGNVGRAIHTIDTLGGGMPPLFCFFSTALYSYGAAYWRFGGVGAKGYMDGPPCRLSQLCRPIQSRSFFCV